MDRQRVIRHFGTSQRLMSGADDSSAGAAQWGRLSRQLGVRRCVQPSAVLGENGLVKGAGVVRAI